MTSRGEIAYWEGGDGEPVLCLHGFPDHPAGLMPLARELAARRRVICPALPGYWPSSAPSDGDYAIPAVAGDLIELLDVLKLDRVALVGHDWGACLGYHIAAHAPDRLSTLVALAAPHPAGFVARRTIFAEQRTAWYAILLAYAPGASRVVRDERWLTALVQSWSPGFHWREWPNVIEVLARPGVPEAVCAYYRADLDAELELEPVRVPATVIHGGQDGCIGPLAFAGLDRWFERGLALHLIPPVGHWPHLEDPAAVVPLIRQGIEASVGGP
jgi:pimeloyl-ACP methyl ester carboxylesterase